MNKTMKISMLILLSGLISIALPIGVLSEEYETATTSAILYLETIDPENPYLSIAKDTVSTDPKTSINFALKGIIESDKGIKNDNLNKALEIMSSIELIPEDRVDMFNILAIESNLTRSQKFIEDASESFNMRHIAASEEILIQTSEEMIVVNGDGLDETSQKLKAVSDRYMGILVQHSNLYRDMALVSYAEDRYLATTLFSIYAKNEGAVFGEPLEDILTDYENEWNSFFGKEFYKESPFSPDSLRELQRKAIKYMDEGNEIFANVIEEYIKFQAMSYKEFINAIQEVGL